MIYFVYLLTTLWSLGCFGLPLWAAWSLWDDGDNGLAVAIGLMAWPIGCLLAVLPWAFISEAQSSDLATLKKNEWFCSQSHPVTTTTYVKSGSVMVPVTSTHQVCDQYNRR